MGIFSHDDDDWHYPTQKEKELENDLIKTMTENIQLRKENENLKRIINKEKKTMKNTLVGIYDKKAKCYISINQVPNTAIACRDFMTACKDEKSVLTNYPDDFCLDKVGTFDNETGELKTEKQTLLEAKNCVATKPEQKDK